MHCPQCGWPEMGKMPAGVRLITQNDKTILFGQLTYVRMESVLCSVCDAMKSAVAERPWFLKAHREYLDQVKAKKHILRGTSRL
jgi:hypothetical protein